MKEWADIAVAWGMSKKMATIHSYLLTADDPVPAEELQEVLSISRGCISTNLSQLVEAGFVKKEYLKDTRKEYYVANKNTFEMLQCAIAYRRKKELTPFLEMLEKFCPTKMNGELSQETINMICEIKHYAVKSDRFLSNLESKSESVFVRSFLKMIK